MAYSIGELFATIGADTTEFDRALKNVGAQVDKTAKELDRFSSVTTRSFNNAGQAATRAGAGINSLRGPLTTLSQQALNANPALSQLSSSLGTFALGSAQMVAVLAGLAAVSTAWRALTADAREARKAQGEARQEFERWLEAQRKAELGPGLSNLAGLSAEQAKLRGLRGQLDTLSRMEGFAGSTAEAELVAALARQQAIVTEGEARLSRVLREQQEQQLRDRIEASDRATQAFKDAAEERIRAAKDEARALAEAMREWVDVHGLGGSGGRKFPEHLRISNIVARPEWRPLGMSEDTLPTWSLDHIEAAEEASRRAARAAEEQARALLEQVYAFEQVSRAAVNFAHALGTVDDQQARMLDSMVALGIAFGTGNVPGMIAGGLAFLGDIFGGGDFKERQRLKQEEAAEEIKRLAEEAQRAAEALAAYTRSLTEDLSVRGLRVAGQDDAAEIRALEIQHLNQLRDFEAEPGAFSTEEGLALYMDLFRVQQAEMEALLESQRQRAAEAGQRAAEEARLLEQERQAYKGTLDVRLLFAQGLSEEAEALQREIEQHLEYEDVLARFGEAMAELVRGVQAAEDAAREAAQAEIELAKQRAAVSAGQDLFSDIATLLNPDDPSTRWHQKWDRIIDEAVRLANAGGITQQQLMDIWNQAYADFEKLKSDLASGTTAAPPTYTGSPGAQMIQDAATASLGDQVVWKGVQTITEYSANRLVDINFSQLIVLRQIEANTRGGPNRALGASFYTDETASGGTAL